MLGGMISQVSVSVREKEKKKDGNEFYRWLPLPPGRALAAHHRWLAENLKSLSNRYVKFEALIACSIALEEDLHALLCCCRARCTNDYLQSEPLCCWLVDCSIVFLACKIVEGFPWSSHQMPSSSITSPSVLAIAWPASTCDTNCAGVATLSMIGCHVSYCDPVQHRILHQMSQGAGDRLQGQ